MAAFATFGDMMKSFRRDEVPFFIPVFNAVSYARFMVDQLLSKGITHFVLVDNGSTYPPMVEYLAQLSQNHRVLYFGDNNGPRAIIEWAMFFDDLPDYFVLSDPDIKFNPNLPSDFIDQMRTVLDAYGVSKIGFALEVSDPEEQARFFDIEKVLEAEHTYSLPEKRLHHEHLILHNSIIDTTFALYNKEKYLDDFAQCNLGVCTSSIRIGGDFTSQHMGWWRDSIMSNEEYDFYCQLQKWSSVENILKKEA